MVIEIQAVTIRNRLCMSFKNVSPKNGIYCKR